MRRIHWIKMIKFPGILVIILILICLIGGYGAMTIQHWIAQYRKTLHPDSGIDRRYTDE